MARVERWYQCDACFRIVRREHPQGSRIRMTRPGHLQHEHEPGIGRPGVLYKIPMLGDVYKDLVAIHAAE